MLGDLTPGICRVAKSNQRKFALDRLQTVGWAFVGRGQNQQVIFLQNGMPFQTVHVQKRVGGDRQICLLGAQQVFVIAGEKDAAMRANAIWKERREAYDDPGLDPDIDAELQDYIAMRKAEQPDRDYF